MGEESREELLEKSLRLNHERLQNDIDADRRAQKLHQTLAGIRIKEAEFSLLHTKEMLRPHHLYHATIGYDASEGKYFCRLLEADNDGDIFEISAYGDTPAAACDNFDKLWVGTRE